MGAVLGRASLSVFAGFLVYWLAAPSSADVQTDYDACKSAYGREEWELVLHYCGRAIQSGSWNDRNLASLLVGRCAAHKNLKQVELALEDCNQALRLDPNYAGAYSERGNVYFAKGQNDRAIDDYGHAIRLDPSFALAYNNRGTAYGAMGQHDRAIQDYNQALRLDPNYAATYANRGNAYYAKGLYDRAIQDYDQALRLDPNDASRLRARGYTKFFAGHFDESVRDLEAYMEREPTYAYGPLWLFVARQRAGLDGTRELDAQAAKLDLTKWPGPLIAFFQGNLNLIDLRLIAERDDPKQNERVCEFNYFIGQAAILRQRPDQARPYLEDATADCPKNFIQYHGAKVELARLPQ
jgi:tetratricopeptide (TPR) repeat protein